MKTTHIGSQKIIEARKNYMFPCLNFFYKDPPQFVSGDMQYLYDHNNKKYLDFFAGVSVMSCGHSNPFILERTINQLKQLQHVCNIYLTQPVADLAKKMAEILPTGITRSFFVNSGTEAVEGAMLLARIATNKRKFIALTNSLHGRTYLAASVTAIPMWRTDPFLENDTVFLPINDYNQTLRQLSQALEEDGENIAAFIAEPIQGNGGIITPPADFFEKARDILHKHNALLVVDEVQTGFARTGKMFCIEHFNTIPDIIAYGKALGNGIPIAGFSAKEDIALKFTKPSASTLGGNPVSCATALAVIEYIEKNHLLENAKTLGDYLIKGLNTLQQKYKIIKEIRGKGLMLGAELENSEQVDFVIEALKDNGIILGKNGINRSVLAFQPPLVITKEDVDFLLENLDKILRSV